MSWHIEQGRIEDVCPRLAESGERFHAVLCDPPYGLEFMGKEWDAPHKETSFPKAGNLGGFADGNKPSFARQKRHLFKLADVFATWGEAIASVLYPGAIVFMFGGTRTWEWCSVGMQMAGFEKWDTLMWLYGSGFPKAQQIDTPGFEGFKTAALKPAWEPILAFRKPSPNTYAHNAVTYGSGALNVDAGRVEYSGPEDAAAAAAAAAAAEMRSRIGSRNFDGWGMKSQDISREEYLNGPAGIGRFPSNVLLDPASAAMLDEQSGNLKSGLWNGHRNEPKTQGVYGNFELRDEVSTYGDSGGASRFFFQTQSDEVMLWKKFASSAGIDSSLSSERAASVLNDAVIWASQGGRQLSAVRGLSTTVTGSELSKIGASVIALTLSTEARFLPASFHINTGRSSGSPAQSVAIRKQTDTMTITTNLTSSDGSAVVVTLSTTPQSADHGEADYPSRFRYCAKASSSERHAGLDAPEVFTKHGDTLRKVENKLPRKGNFHPTVKPIDLCRYLASLLLPPDSVNPRRLLVPFSGSGSEIIGAMQAGWDEVVGIEREADYVEIAKSRIIGDRPLFNTPTESESAPAEVLQ